jgi:hypothetical protein
MMSRLRARVRTTASFCVASAIAVAAQAQVTEPNGKMVPVPSPMGEIQVVTSRGFPADSVTLTGLFKYRGENIDSVKNATISPGSFSPRCGFSGQMVLRGGDCTVDFGWYNATEPPTMPDKINILIPNTAYSDPNGYACSGALAGSAGFCPLATHTTTQSQNTFVEKVYGSDTTIRNSPNYKGGLIGFAFVGGGTSSRCSETHYSQQALNTGTDLPAGQHWITALIWQSTATPDGYYIGFEDLPMTAQHWMDGSTDGDFNDFVFFLSGLTCKGGGEPCTVPNAIGACAAGKTDCDSGSGMPACHQIYTPHPEVCDNIDNDCNGQVDDGDGLCPTGKFCFQGKCVGNCMSGEFTCPPGLGCEDGHCVDPMCASVTCPMGQVCQGGQCVGGCDNVVCPTGQDCVLGRCIDPCSGVDCSSAPGDAGMEAMRVCEKGVCISSCGCRGCDNGQVCAASGHCVDPGCETMNCATGQICKAGSCTDICTPDVKCPGGTPCIDGICQDPPSGSTSSGSDTTTGSTGAIITVTGGGGGTSASGSSGTDSSGTVAGSDTTQGLDTGTTGRARAADDKSGCSCRIEGVRDRSLAGGSAAGVALGLAALRFSRRRRSRRS